MIVHDFSCQNDNCGHVEKNVLCNADKPLKPLKHCGKTMEICWQNLTVAVKVFPSFDTRNIHPDGKSLHVGSKGDLEFYAREYGVRHVDDPDLEAVGSEIRKKSSWKPTAFVDMGGKR